MVGGFSFYERAEIKDHDRPTCKPGPAIPHDSMALHEGHQHAGARHRQDHASRPWSALALETGTSTWETIGAAIQNRLVPARASMALESFRQLILDAQAMMDPDFAGKLAADVAETDDLDTGFGFGAAADEAAKDSADTSFGFGASEENSQMTLLDSSHFSPFADEPKRPFLQMPKKTKAPADKAGEDEASAFRAPGDAATLPELIRFHQSIARVTSRRWRRRVLRKPSAGLKT
jgi:DNA helicase II / ATP-dependent DNA helicase PcrA